MRPCYNTKCQNNGSSRAFGWQNNPFCQKLSIVTMEDESKCSYLVTFSMILRGEEAATDTMETANSSPIVKSDNTSTNGDYAAALKAYALEHNNMFRNSSCRSIFVEGLIERLNSANPNCA